MDAIEQKTSEKKEKGYAPTVIRYTVYVNINTHIYIYIFIYIFLCVCVCFYDLAMPICIILDPLNWTRPDLIHIEGHRHRHDARAPEGPAPEEASTQGGSPLPDEPAAAPCPQGMAQKGGSPGGRVTRAPAKAASGRGKPSGRRL